MDLEHGSKKPPAAPAAAAPTRNKLLQLRDRLVAVQPVVLRAAAALAAVVAAVVMALNTQSYTAVVAIVGTRPLTQTFTAEFRDTPAFVYFVIANAIAGAYNLVVLIIRRLTLRRRTASLVVHMLDMVIMALLATGAATAASMAELGKNGNLHARWNPICDSQRSPAQHGGPMSSPHLRQLIHNNALFLHLDLTLVVKAAQL
ncbi:hypothetical protein PAHAL_3G494300 [Panicum hallii]|uniref:CASP-like protein n=1 Tax=Panicum hallii TaxID=206008 RepID=A0A2T8KM06_9POAL|nr:hypothetical protein PAHAL_3G494300 [Panicum hallii]